MIQKMIALGLIVAALGVTIASASAQSDRSRRGCYDEHGKHHGTLWCGKHQH